MEVFRRGMAGSFVAAGLVAVTALGAASVSAGPISTTADNPGNVLMSDSWDACGVPAGSGFPAASSRPCAARSTTRTARPSASE